MRAGQLRHRIELQHRSQGKATTGEVTETFATYDTVWAAVEPMRGAEAITAQEQKGQAWFKITIRYNAAVLITDRIVHRGRVFEVNYGPDFQERNIFQELTCTEVI